MDENPSQNTDLLDPPEPEERGPSMGQRAVDAGRSVKDNYNSAKDLLGKSSGLGAGGEGLGNIGNSLKNGLGDIGKGLSGSAGSGADMGGMMKSMDGMKGMGDKVSQMFKGMEGSSKPHDPNNPASEANPAAADAAKKTAGKAVDKTAQAVGDAVEGVKDAKDAARLVGSGGTDATAWLDLAKRALKDPKAFVKRYGRYALYAFGFFALQFMVIAVIVGGIFFGIYKVYLAGKSVWDNPLNIANTLRVSTDMGTYLAKFVTQLSYEREQQSLAKGGVAVAASNDYQNYNLSGLKVNPETDKMFTTWNNAGLAEKFLDDYSAEIKPNGSARQVDSFDPSAWDLYVSGRNIGTLNSTPAQAYISLFAEDTTHWSDIYTRLALKDAAQKKFDTTSFKLDLPDPKDNIDNSRQNVTQKVVKDTLSPISKNAGAYYNCLIDGGSDCDTLGLGSTNSPSNNPSSGGGGGLLGSLLQAIQGAFALISGSSGQATVAKDQLVAFANGKSSEITADSATYGNKSALAANISTAASDAVLSGIDDAKHGGSNQQTDSKTMLQMYDQFQNSLDNKNFSRVNYDRTSRQSVSEGLNYFVGGGQLLNGDMNLLDSWAMTENLNAIDQSQTLQQAVFGNPIGAYAQSATSDSGKVCQQVYNDGDPVGKADDSNLKRPVKDASCFTQSLLPNVDEFKNEKQLNDIYKQLDVQSKSHKSSNGILGLLGSIIANLTQNITKLQQGKIRTSPVSANAVNLSDSLAPDFDAYTNQVYGTSKTGAETDAQLYDTLNMGTQSLWTEAEATGPYSTGGSYQNDAAVAETMRYAAEFKRAQYAFEPFSQRMFAMKSPDSLAGKLALLTPTNANDATKKTLALFKPSNLTSAVAARLTPTSIAQSVSDKQVNPVSAIRVGRQASDPNNTKPSEQVWSDNNCDAGGPQQATGQPDAIPFIVPTSTNPCKQVTVLSTMTTCYLDEQPQDTCTLSSDSGGNVGGATPGQVSSDSSGTPCYAGTNTIGITGSKEVPDEAYSGGDKIRIKLCEVPIIPCSNQECTTYGNGHAVVSSIASEAWFKLASLAKTKGIPLTATSSWRSMSHQQSLCNQNPACRSGSYTAVARPGTSNHQAGLAIDVSEAGMGKGAASGRSCTNPQTVNTPTYLFLEQYARQFGIRHYANESWHWGTAEKC